LPEPASADRSGLLRWLVLRDLEREPPEVCRALARRFEQEFAGGVNLGATKDRLNPAQQERVWNNVIQLLKAWFADRVDRYAQASAAERTAVVDATIDTISVWKGIGDLRADANPTAGPSEPKGLLPLFLERLDEWKRDLEPQRQQQMTQFVQALEARWIQRKLSGVFKTAVSQGQPKLPGPALTAEPGGERGSP
jgi:hypothetical protein